MESITEAPQWDALVKHAGQMADAHLRRLFTDDPDRGERLTLEAAGLYLDYSKHRVTDETLRLLVEHGFGDGRLHRIEAHVDPDDLRTLRLLSHAGLRREGVLRGHASAGEERVDRVLMARLVSDPAADTRDGFIAMLNAGLPRKRVISQALIRDPDDRVLLCELTYKAEWDLPGGVVEPLESPATGLARELREELGLDVGVGDLVTVNWLPAWRGWDDACVFVFDGGRLAAESVDRMKLQPTEIRAVHWCTPAQVSTRATAATIRLLEAVAARRGHYLEDGSAGSAS